jgi:hypothetical protein
MTLVLSAAQPHSASIAVTFNFKCENCGAISVTSGKTPIGWRNVFDPDSGQPDKVMCPTCIQKLKPTEVGASCDIIRLGTQHRTWRLDATSIKELYEYEKEQSTFQ